MDFGFSPEQEALRREVRAFIAENFTDEVRAAIRAEEVEGAGIINGPQNPPILKDLYRKIGERGWLGISYPREYGGQGGSPIDQYIVEEEFYRESISIGFEGSGAPNILAAGTEEQKQFYIPRLIRGEIVLCFGFTEPQAGSDLAGIKCRAVRDGDEYVINGQKIYTSLAHFATHVYLLARTHPESERRNGMSIFLIPMDTPGITVRPLRTIQNDPLAPPGTTYGTAQTNETFYDDVRVPVEWILGEEHNAWAVSAAGLNLDRVGAWRYLWSVKRDEDIVNYVKSHKIGGHDISQDPVVRDKLAELWTEAQVSRLMTMRSMSIMQNGSPFTYEGSAEKVWAPEHGVKASETIAQILGPYGQLLNGSPFAVQNGIYAHNLQGAFQSGINHGSTQTMRDQVARYGLGMPRRR
jgi:alkylation response protein AidB-like acyl-CoA dehydrogenase